MKYACKMFCVHYIRSVITRECMMIIIYVCIINLLSLMNVQCIYISFVLANEDYAILSICHASIIRITCINLHNMIINNKKKAIHLDQVVYFYNRRKANNIHNEICCKCIFGIAFNQICCVAS